MSALDPILASLKRLDPEALLELRPAYPPVAIEIDRGQMTLVRVKRRRRKLPILDAYRIQSLPEQAIGATIFRPNLGSPAETAALVRELFDRSGTKPGRVSLILPDNLAKVSIVTLPERPAGQKQLREMLQFKLRRSVPFRLEDAVVSSSALPGPGPEAHFLVGVMMRSVVEHYEAAFEAVGARLGLVDLCTPSLFNLARAEIAKELASGSDAALLNCARDYFTLMIVRADRLVFFRCKTYAGGEDEGADARITVMGRELASSLSYYAEKLSGVGVGTVFVRAVAPELDQVVPVFERLGFVSVRPIDVAFSVQPSPEARFEPIDGQTLAPAVGGAAGRTAS